MKLHILLVALTLGGATAASAKSNWTQWRWPNRELNALTSFRWTRDVALNAEADRP